MHGAGASFQTNTLVTLVVVVLQEVLSQLSFRSPSSCQFNNTTLWHCQWQFQSSKSFPPKSGPAALWHDCQWSARAKPDHSKTPVASSCCLFHFPSRNIYGSGLSPLFGVLCSTAAAAAAINRPNHSSLPWLRSFIPLLSNGGQFIYTASSKSKKHIGIPTFGLLVALLLPCQ